MSFIFPAVCLNSFLTEVLECAPLAIISLENAWNLVSDAAVGLHR